MRRLRNLVMAATILGLIGLNVATLTVSSVFAALSGAVEALDLNGSRATLRAKADRLAAENRRLVRDRDRARARASRLGRERTALARANRRLGAETREVRLVADGLRRRAEIRGAHVRRLTGGVLARAGRVASANLAAMPLEAVPLFGVASIVGATAFELHQLCAISRDMNALRANFGLDQQDEQASTVCGLRVPTVRELTAQVAGRELDADQLHAECTRDLPSFEEDPRAWTRCGAILAPPSP